MDAISIGERLFYCTVRVESVSDDGSASVGTGFLFGQRIAATEFAPFIVTNKHVVAGSRGGAMTFHHAAGDQPHAGRSLRVEVEDWSGDWVGHPSPDIDVTVTPFLPIEMAHGPKTALFKQFVSSDSIPSAEQVLSLDAIEQVTFLGYPNGIWDARNFLPIARRGTTATPFSVDYEGTPRFLIDASVFPGSSGSPVFIYNNGTITDKFGNTTVGRRVLFLGIIASVYYRTALNEVFSLPVPTVAGTQATRQTEMLDLAIAFKAVTVVETINHFLRSRGAA